MTHYGFGLRLASALPIPGALAGVADDPGDTLAIHWGAPAPLPPTPRFERDGGAIVYHGPDGGFRCDVDTIAVTPPPRPDLDDLGALLIANALPATLWRRGAYMLHAAAVRLKGGPTIAIAGASGSGKSRAAAALVAAGGELIGDDSLALSLDLDGVVAAGLPGGWFARPDAGGARRFQPAPPGPARGVARLDLIATIDPDADHATATPLPALAAVEQLLRHRHRPQAVALLGREAAVLAQATALAARLPVARIGARGATDALVGGLRRLADRVPCPRARLRQ